eukprot:1190361-Prorocentrum_minimum.AAC.1
MLAERGSTHKQRLKTLQQWQRQGGVFLLGYEAFRDFALGARRGMNTAQKVPCIPLLCIHLDCVL